MNDEVTGKNPRLKADLTDVDLSSIVIQDGENIESASPSYPQALAAASKVSLVFQAPLGSGRSKGGVVGKVASRASIERESSSDDDGESDAECKIPDSNKAIVQDDVSSLFFFFETLI